jgi:hypothetical protein
VEEIGQLSGKTLVQFLFPRLVAFVNFADPHSLGGQLLRTHQDASREEEGSARSYTDRQPMSGKQESQTGWLQDNDDKLVTLVHANNQISLWRAEQRDNLVFHHSVKISRVSVALDDVAGEALVTVGRDEPVFKRIRRIVI